MGTLYVRNEAQKVLWTEELMGQISDGLWENAKPTDAWIAWSEATVVVRPELVGRDFAVLKDNYALTDKRLLDVVDLRMIASVQALPEWTSYARADLLRDLKDLKKIMRVRLQDEAGQRFASVARLPVPPPVQEPAPANSVADGQGGFVESDAHGSFSVAHGTPGEWSPDGNGGWTPKNATALAQVRKDVTRITAEVVQLKREVDAR